MPLGQPGKKYSSWAYLADGPDMTNLLLQVPRKKLNIINIDNEKPIKQEGMEVSEYTVL